MPQPSPEQMINELFGPNFINYIRSDPEFSSYLDDPDFMEKFRPILRMDSLMLCKISVSPRYFAGYRFVLIR